MNSAASAFIATLLVLASGSATPQTAPRWTAYNVDPQTIRAYVNADGVPQFEAIVLYADDRVSGHVRTAVTGCRDGQGQISEVDDTGKPRVSWSSWNILGQALRDSIARSICLVAAHHSPKEQRSGGSWT